MSLLSPALVALLVALVLALVVGTVLLLAFALVHDQLRFFSASSDLLGTAWTQASTAGSGASAGGAVGSTLEEPLTGIRGVAGNAVRPVESEILRLLVALRIPVAAGIAMLAELLVRAAHGRVRPDATSGAAA
jgi:hypothetical protein